MRVLVGMSGGVDSSVAAAVLRDAGFSVGGVAPFGHDLPVILDETLLKFDQVWAAGGDGNTLFCVQPQKLSACIKATVADVAATG